jgi:hypothetical protein
MNGRGNGLRELGILTQTLCTPRRENKKKWGSLLDTLILSIFYIYFNCKWVFTLWKWYYNKTQHTNNTHHTK